MTFDRLRLRHDRLRQHVYLLRVRLFERATALRRLLLREIGRQELTVLTGLAYSFYGIAHFDRGAAYTFVGFALLYLGVRRSGPPARKG